MKGHCQNCEESLEFEDYLLGDSATCPHCSQLTLLEAARIEPAKEFLHAGLTSGKEIKISAVMLYAADQIRIVQEKRQRMESLSAGFSTGLSPWGSIGWVLEASAAISVIEGVLSAAPNAAAKQLLRELPADYRAIETSGTYFNAALISGREWPNPSAWSSQKRTRHYIHDGSPFLKYKSEEGQTAMLRTDSIIYYEISAIGAKTEPLNS